jgi:hypothetical protein
MKNQELQNLVKKLQEEIKNAKTINEQDKQLLSQLEAEIDKILGKSEEKQLTIQTTTIKRLEDSINHFEATHPTLTTLLSQLLDDLSTAGL